MEKKILNNNEACNTYKKYCFTKKFVKKYFKSKITQNKHFLTRICDGNKSKRQ